MTQCQNHELSSELLSGLVTSNEIILGATSSSLPLITRLSLNGNRVGLTNFVSTTPKCVTVAATKLSHTLLSIIERSHTLSSVIEENHTLATLAAATEKSHTSSSVTEKSHTLAVTETSQTSSSATERSHTLTAVPEKSHILPSVPEKSHTLPSVMESSNTLSSVSTLVTEKNKTFSTVIDNGHKSFGVAESEAPTKKLRQQTSTDSKLERTRAR